LLAEKYAHGKAVEMAPMRGIDAMIEPADVEH
jgi:hypothetical protein